ncbi:MAG: alpha/beta fold hydrolase [Armatimonadetes bacterium]|nr:alpha/beta fold hydrolase [Armatimonadota bacterium]
MSKVFKFVVSFVLISVVIYFGIIAVLLLTGKPKKPEPAQRGPAFDELFFDYSSLPELKSYTARDGTQLAYRHYPADSDKIVILLHGAAWHTRYFLPLAESISSEGLAQVYTPDLRGHGLSPKRRGDVDYIGQFEDDLADLIAMIQKDNPNSMLIMGGHSSGGGLAIRFAGSQYGRKAKAYLLMSPFLKYNAPTTRVNWGGFAKPYTGRIIGLVMLNNVGIRWFNYLTVIEFNMPEKARDGTETLSYSYRLTTAYAPHDYEKALSAITQPLLVVAGTKDETMIYCQYEPVISQYTTVQVKLLQGVSHMGLVVCPEVRPVIKEWLEGLGEP